MVSVTRADGGPIEGGDWALEAHGEGIYFVAGPVGLPPDPIVDGIRYHRFMDRILLPTASNLLTPVQVIVANRLRRRLAAEGRQMMTNYVVKTAFAEVLRSHDVQAVIEWGPGFEPLSDHYPVKDYVGVDLDPDARRGLNEMGLRCVAPDDEGALAALEAPEFLVAVFVFHFPLNDMEIHTMRRLAGDGTTILANVYRLDDQSRRQLRGRFELAGLRISTRTDPDALCRGQEFWGLAMDDPSPVVGLLSRTSQALAEEFMGPAGC